MRRVSARVFATCAAGAVRHLTPSEELKKLYESDFDKQKFPADVVPSQTSIFAQFLYKAAEPKNGQDAILKDLEAIAKASKTLPVFWERTIDVEKQAEFKGFQPATIFTLKWMQANGMLGELSTVRATFETFCNAKNGRIVAKVYLPGPEKDHAAAVKEAKEIAAKIQASAGNKNKLEFNFVEESDFASGYAVEVCDQYYSTAKGKYEKSEKASAADVDYTNLPAHTPIKTKWEDNIETEVLRKYIDQLSKYDLEEQTNGV